MQKFLSNFLFSSIFISLLLLQQKQIQQDNPFPQICTFWGIYFIYRYFKHLFLTHLIINSGWFDFPYNRQVSDLMHLISKLIFHLVYSLFLLKTLMGQRIQNTFHLVYKAEIEYISLFISSFIFRFKLYQANFFVRNVNEAIIMFSYKSLE